MPPKTGEGGRSTANSQRSLFAREKDPIQPSGGAETITGNKDVQDALFQQSPPSGGAETTLGNKDVQDALFQPIPPSGGEVTEEVLLKEPGQDHDPSAVPQADVQPVRGDDAMKSPANFRRQ